MPRPQSAGDGGGWILAVVLCISLYSCLSAPPDKGHAQRTALRGDAKPTVFQRVAATMTIGRDFDESSALDMAGDDLSGMSYQDERGYLNCTDDCSGHEAGWIAARDDDQDCGFSENESFSEGCTAYREAVALRVGRARKAFDDGDDAFVRD